MIFNSVTLMTICLLMSMVTSDSVTQYVEANKNKGQDRGPVIHVMDNVIKMTRDLVAEARTVLDQQNLLGGVRLAALTITGLYILSAVSVLIAPVLIFMAIYSFPDFVRGLNVMISTYQILWYGIQK